MPATQAGALRVRPFIAVTIAICFLATRSRAADIGVAPEQATFFPGKETKILDPKTGGLGWYVVYVPKDYSPEREWPTIFCYHVPNPEQFGVVVVDSEFRPIALEEKPTAPRSNSLTLLLSPRD